MIETEFLNIIYVSCSQPSSNKFDSNPGVLIA
jgi:hypothetical protein